MASLGFLNNSESSEDEVVTSIEVKTPEMETYLDSTGTYCLKCRTKTKDIEPVVYQVSSRKKTGGIRDVVKSKCGFCNANKNKFVTVSKVEKQPIVDNVKPKRGRKCKVLDIN